MQGLYNPTYTYGCGENNLWAKTKKNGQVRKENRLTVSSRQTSEAQKTIILVYALDTQIQQDICGKEKHKIGAEGSFMINTGGIWNTNIDHGLSNLIDDIGDIVTLL